MQKFTQSLQRLISALLALIIMFSCSKDNKGVDENYTCTTCSSTPVAVAANNTVNKGIYKGVLIGSSGTLIFDIQNTKHTITGTMVIDGIVVALTCDADDPDVNSNFEGIFRGALNGNPVAIVFRVGKDGTNPTIVSANIPGHPGAVLIVAKETSDTLLECYEGAYTITGDWTEKGTYNFLVARKSGGGKWSAIAAEDGYPEEFTSGTGFMSGNNIVDANRNGQGADVVIATISGHTISGNFVDTDGDEVATVNHKGKRTL